LKIKLIATRIQKRNEIYEIFTWNPKTKYSFDNSRQLQQKIRLQIAKLSLHNKIPIKLTDIKYFNDNIVFCYNIIHTINIPLTEVIEFDYYPTLKNKTCKNCFYLRTWKQKLVCLIKTNPSKKLVGCYSWLEKDFISEKDKYGRLLYKRSRSTGNAKTNQ
jgi:hypothetical protein